MDKDKYTTATDVSKLSKTTLMRDVWIEYWKQEKVPGDLIELSELGLIFEKQTRGLRFVYLSCNCYRSERDGESRRFVTEIREDSLELEDS